MRTTIARRHCHKLKMRKYMKFNKNKRPAELAQAAAAAAAKPTTEIQKALINKFPKIKKLEFIHTHQHREK